MRGFCLDLYSFVLVLCCALAASASIETPAVNGTHNAHDKNHKTKHSLLDHNSIAHLNAVQSPQSRSNLHRAMTLLRSGRCEHVYLDVGTNIGVQIRKLYQPSHYPGALILPLFDSNFGSTDEDRKRVCAFGFEPNPHWTSRLREIESSYSKHGYPVVIFTETAAGVDNNNITFFMEPTEKPDVHEWGASTLQWHKDMEPVTAGTISLAQFINNEVNKRPGKTAKSKMIMKLDIEGAEFVVLPDLLLNHALCEFNCITCELHARFVPDHPKNIDDFLPTINYLLRKTPNCTAQVLDQDDESYGTGADTVPLPARLRHLRGAPRETSSTKLTYPLPSIESSQHVWEDFEELVAQHAKA